MREERIPVSSGPVRENPRLESLRRQSIWLLSAKLVGFAFSFAIPLVVVRLLSQEQVGEYRAAFLVIANAIVVLPIGVSMSAYYFLARETESRRAACILNILLFNFTVGAAAFLFLWMYPGFLGRIFQSGEIVQVAPLIGAVIWVWIFASLLEIVAIANQEPRLATVFIVSAQFSKAFFMSWAAFFVGTVEGFLYAAIIQGILQALILGWYLASRFPRFWTEFDRAFLKEQLTYALPFGVAGTLWLAQTEIHSWFAGHKFSPSEFAVYAYGCFEIPLIAMLAESVTAVLIPKMNALHGARDRDEMVRLKARAMQKLALVYFPIYAFLLVTADTFITTLFTERYSASTRVFLVNITLLPFSILVTDPILRSYKELGKIFVLTRFVIVTILVTTLYFFLDAITMTGMIGIAVAAVIFDRLIAEVFVIKKLELGIKDLGLLSPVVKTAAASVAAGVPTFALYTAFRPEVTATARDLFYQSLHIQNAGIANFLAGSTVLIAAAAVFAPIYFGIALVLGLIDEEERAWVKGIFRKATPDRKNRLSREARSSA